MTQFYKLFEEIDKIYFFTMLLLSVGIIITSLEYLSIHKEFKSDGVFSWKVFSSRPEYFNLPPLFKKFNFIFDHIGFILLHSLRLFSAVFLPFVEIHWIKIVLLLFLFISTLFFSFRNIVGNDGSDQMNSLIIVTLMIVYIINQPSIYKIGIIFIAIQSILSYVIAGIAKLASQKWRNGVAVFEIMNTRTYGQENIARFLLAAPKSLNYFICWNIIIFEVLFFAVLFLPEPWFLVFLLGGVAFHAYNSVAMGLNNFFWSFTATYPCIIFLHFLITK